jgi:hypothetical protein
MHRCCEVSHGSAFEHCRAARPHDAHHGTGPTSERQFLHQRRILQRLESERKAEGLKHLVLCIHNQRICRDLPSSLHTAIDGAAQQRLARFRASLIRSTCTLARQGFSVLACPTTCRLLFV